MEKVFMLQQSSSSTSSLTQVDVETSPFIDSCEKPRLDDGPCRRVSLKEILKSYFWVATTFVLALSQIATLLQTWQAQNTGTYETGFATDLEPAKQIIDLEKRFFTGGLSLDEDGKLFRERERGQPQYVGPPSPEIDDAWEGIMTASEIVLSGKDATDVVRSSIEEPEGGAWRLELDVYHSLHCVNQVRQAVDVDYYFPNKTTPSFYRAHIDHCIDYLRQVIQCQSDMTPLTFYWNEQIKAHLPNFEHPHTCRNFDKVHQWAIRHKAAGRVANSHHS